jgi:tRNA A-37 threonylcarbamoyl transferase component Bud32
MLHTRTVDSYHFGFSLNLAEAQLRILAGFLDHHGPAGVPVLGGRTSVSPLQLDGIGAVVVKHYRRGGLIRHLVKSRYLRFGKTRSQREFEQLSIARSLGINVPQPVAYAHRGGLFYSAWLAARAIEEPITLARLSLQDADAARRAAASAVEQIALLIQHNILHVDLHPGNVVVDNCRRVYLVDFDKTGRYRGGREKLKRRYIRRWQRAVVKHRLPQFLAEMLRRELN